MHIAIIPDGNRRWGKKKGINKILAHKKAVEKLRKNFLGDGGKKLKRLIQKYNIKEITIYALSTENLKRTKRELDALFSLFKTLGTEILNALKNKKSFFHNFKIRFYGLLHLLPEDLQQLMKKIESKSRGRGKIKLNICIAYGGRAEIIEAVKKIIEKGIRVKELNEKIFYDNLWVKNDPDIVIRTGGMIRTSNFLPWQTIYSEWFFLNKYFPELTINDIEEVIKEFYKRKRNFGK